MNFFVGNKSDLDEEQLNVSISGPSNSSQKTKNDKISWDFDDIEFGNSLVNLAQRHDRFYKINKEEKFEKHKNKTSEPQKECENRKIKQLLLDRLKMYINAEENARKTGDMRKVRHLNNKIQILNALIRHHNAGNVIDPENIPPEIKNNEIKLTNHQLGVTFKESAEITVIPRPTDLDSNSVSDTNSEVCLEKLLATLRLRRDQYKISVAQNKRSGNVSRALEHLNIVKMFESVIRHLEMGDKVDLNELPGPPGCSLCHINSGKKNSAVEVENTTEDNSKISFNEQVISNSTILHALQDRLKVYEISRMHAKKENNVGQALHIERIIKIYKEAIKLHRAGKSFPIDELPSPPNFAPLAYLKLSHKYP